MPGSGGALTRTRNIAGSRVARSMTPARRLRVAPADVMLVAQRLEPAAARAAGSRSNPRARIVMCRRCPRRETRRRGCPVELQQPFDIEDARAVFAGFPRAFLWRFWPLAWIACRLLQSLQKHGVPRSAVFCQLRFALRAVKTPATGRPRPRLPPSRKTCHRRDGACCPGSGLCHPHILAGRRDVHCGAL